MVSGHGPSVDGVVGLVSEWVSPIEGPLRVQSWLNMINVHLLRHICMVSVDRHTTKMTANTSSIMSSGADQTPKSNLGM